MDFFKKNDYLKFAKIQFFFFLNGPSMGSTFMVQLIMFLKNAWSKGIFWKKIQVS